LHKRDGEPLGAASERIKTTSKVGRRYNVGGGNAGAIAAALFLEEFVSDVPWAHLDIAGPALPRKTTRIFQGGVGFCER
jgi:leucyl aminopeptidase